MPYNVVIVDDEPLGITVLKTYLQEAADFSVVACFTDAEAAVHYLRQHAPDLLLLDINMPLVNGFQLLDQITPSIITILTTAHKKYLQEGFDYGVLDYLQKPIKKERLQRALDRAKQTLQHQQALKKVETSITSQIYMKAAQKEFYIQKSDILFIKGLKDYCAVHLVTQEKIIVLGSLKAFLANYNTDNWLIRVHRSYAVVIQHILGIQNTTMVYVKDASIPIGRKYRDAFLTWYRNNKFFFTLLLMVCDSTVLLAHQQPALGPFR